MNKPRIHRKPEPTSFRASGSGISKIILEYQQTQHWNDTTADGNELPYDSHFETEDGFPVKRIDRKGTEFSVIIDGRHYLVVRETPET